MLPFFTLRWTVVARARVQVNVKIFLYFFLLKMKKVRFSEVPSVRVMHVWSYASRVARTAGMWEEAARDRARFERRIGETSKILEPMIKKKLAEIAVRNCECNPRTVNASSTLSPDAKFVNSEILVTAEGSRRFQPAH